MPARPPHRRLPRAPTAATLCVLVLVLALAPTGCGGAGGAFDPTPGDPGSASSPPARLRATLAARLTDRLFLSALAARPATAPQRRAAVAAEDRAQAALASAAGGPVDALSPRGPRVAEALRRVAAGDPGAPSAVAALAADVPAVAATTARSRLAHDDQRAEAVTPAAALRAALATQLVAQLHLTAAAATLRSRSAPPSAAAQRAAADAALDAATHRIARELESVFGDVPAQEAFTALRRLSTALTSYAKAKAAGDRDAAQAAITVLAAADAELGDALEGADGGLHHEVVVPELRALTTALTAAVRAAGAGSPKAPALLAAATAQAPALAARIAAAAADRLPASY